MTTSRRRPPSRVTAADVARSLGVSRATVGFVLNDTPGQTISAATRSRVLAEAKRLGYRPHSAARALASGRSRIVLMLLPDWPMDHAVHAYIDEAGAALDRLGYALVTTSRFERHRVAPMWEMLSPSVVVSMAPLSPSVRAQVDAMGIPVIEPGALADRNRQEVPLDNGAALQVDHLVEQGRAHLAYAFSDDSRISGLVAQRLEAARAAAARAGIAEPITTAVDEGTAAQAVERWAENGVDGVVAYNDQIAALVLGAALRAGRRVPEDLAIIGHDDTPLAGLLVPSLSSIRMDLHGLGTYIAELVLNVLEDSPLPPVGPAGDLHLVRREST